MQVTERRERRPSPVSETPVSASAKPDPPADGADDSVPPGSADGLLRVLLVDDHEVVRTGIRRLLEAQDGIVVVDEVESVRAAIAAADRCHPDVIVMDVLLTDGTGIEATREIRNKDPRIRVLMLTASDDREALFSSIMAGASGYVLKRVKGEDLVRAVRTVGAGQDLLDPAITGALLDGVRGGASFPQDDDRLSRLSPQETRVLALIAEGLTNGDIGARLGVAEKTVRNYVSSLLGKLEVSRRAEAAAYLARRSAGQGNPQRQVDADDRSG